MQKTHAPNRATDQRLLLRRGDRGSIRKGGHLGIAHLPAVKGRTISERGTQRHHPGGRQPPRRRGPLTSVPRPAHTLDSGGGVWAESGRAGPYIALPRGGKSGLSTRAGPARHAWAWSAAAAPPSHRGGRAGGSDGPAADSPRPPNAAGSGGEQRRRSEGTAASPNPPPARPGVAWPGLVWPLSPSGSPSPNTEGRTSDQRDPQHPLGPRASRDRSPRTASRARSAARPAAGGAPGPPGPCPDPLPRPRRAARAARRHVGARSAPWRAERGQSRRGQGPGGKGRRGKAPWGKSSPRDRAPQQPHRGSHTAMPALLRRPPRPQQCRFRFQSSLMPSQFGFSERLKRWK